MASEAGGSWAEPPAALLRPRLGGFSAGLYSQPDRCALPLHDDLDAGGLTQPSGDAEEVRERLDRLTVEGDEPVPVPQAGLRGGAILAQPADEHPLLAPLRPRQEAQAGHADALR